MPRFPIERATNFIVEQESWTVIEYDHTSVPGIVYLSLTEGKVNSLTDNLIDNIADIDKLADYQLVVPNTEQIFSINSKIEPRFTLTKNGVPIDATVVYIPMNKAVAKIINGELMAVGAGETDIVVQLQEYPTIQQTLHITVGSEEQEFGAYIEGEASLRLDRTATYILKSTSTLTDSVIFTIDNLSLATIKQVENNTCTIQANNKNKLGSITLTAHYNNKEYSKQITIAPLW